MKKICIILPKGLPVPALCGGAIETLITSIIDINEEKKNFEITVVSSFNKILKKYEKTYKKTEFIYVKQNLRYIIKAILYKIYNSFSVAEKKTYQEIVLNKIKKNDYDYIIVEGGPQDFYTSYTNFFDNKKMILHIHHNEIFSEIANETFGNIIFVSDYIKSSYIKNSKENSNKFKVVLNGINTSKFTKKIFEKEKGEIRKKLGVKNDDFIVIYAGRVIPEKGVLELVEAINLIEDKSIKLIIIGDLQNNKSDYVSEINNIIKNSSSKIISAGYVNNDELYKFYQSSDLAVVPSLWEEAAGLVIIEQLISKLPIITTGSGGIPEYASDSVYYIKRDKNIKKNIAKKINYIKENKKDVDKSASNRLKQGLKFSENQMYQDFSKVINSIGENSDK